MRLDGRNGAIWRAYTFGGRTQEAIAEEYGITQERVSQILAAVRASIPDDDLSELRRVHTENLLSVHAALADIAALPLPPAYSNGRPIIDENGEMVRDVSSRMAALMNIAKIETRAAQLLGLDASVKVDVTVNEQARQAAASAAADAVARMTRASEDTPE